MPHIAVIGAGYWGENLVRNFAKLGALHTVCDSDTDRLKELQSRWPQIRVSTVFSEVLQDTEIDAVAIAAPAALHHSLTKAALCAGKDVFVEKPLALTATEGEELTALSHQMNRILMVGHLLEHVHLGQ